MKLIRLSLGAALALLLSICCEHTSYAQHEMINIKRKADVWDNAKPQTYFKIPELESKDGILEVHLYISEQVYLFNGDSIKMRTYTYEHLGKIYRSNMGPNGIVGPWAPTLKIGKNDRLTVVIHNQLPDSRDENYLCSIGTEYTENMNTDKLGKKFKEVIQEASIIYGDPNDPDDPNDTLITIGNLDGADIETVIKDSSWIIHGRVPCPCGSGKKTCTKVYIDYPVYLDYNYGTQTNALRINQAMKHDEEDGELDHNTPHGFSRTNLHMHGFHVSPFQDDIFRNVDPTYSSYYTYDLKNHTSGTMWYHPHIHGSTSIQVASGMSGAVIIKDAFGPKDKALELASMPKHERVMVFNQLVYDTTLNETPDFETLERSNAPKGTTVNGISVPIMKIQPGEVQRWRMVHAGYRSNVAIQFPKGAIVYQIAVDGILFEKPKLIESLHMAPGNRSDILIRFHKNLDSTEFAVESVTYYSECEYFEDDSLCIYDSINSIEEDIMKIRVAGTPMDMSFPKTLPDNGHTTITYEELVNKKKPRPTVFYVGDDPDPIGGDTATVFMVNGEQYDGAKIPDTLLVGDAEQWLISSKGGGHPYHIHVNPFQVQEFAGRKVDPPMWKDVVMVDPTHPAVVYARYEVYWGDFVLHCHILAHEDEGMMQRVRIIRPIPIPTPKE
ncbi:MAG: FtsP/CotA-like multicopper oxidase with cupredoxin domain [Crocinitomix sp.]|jgi:FtsP/CotA-like multicopper oxidase with cupredoxin domain